MRPQLINVGVKALTLPPRLAGRVAGEVLGAAGSAAGAVLDRVRPDGREPDAPRPRVVPSPPEDRPMAGTAEAVADVIAEATPDAPPVAHAELPLEDYDHLTIGALRSRIRTLGREELGQVQAYEAAHANRLPVLTVLTNRLRDLDSAAGQPPA